jgi:hypothetical protein
LEQIALANAESLLQVLVWEKVLPELSSLISASQSHNSSPIIAKDDVIEVIPLAIDDLGYCDLILCNRVLVFAMLL